MAKVSLIGLLLAICVASSYAGPGMLVVLYSYPTDSGGAIWSAIKNAKVNNPSLPVMVIANPDSGPGTSKDNTYANAITDLVNVGITVIGYVSTDYTNVAITTAKANMDSYKAWYTGVTGFFLDEMKNDVGGESYYTNLTQYAVSIGLPYTMGNPGTASLPSYINTVNNSVIYEHHPLPRPEVLNLGYSIEKCSLIAYDVPASAVNQTYINTVSQYVSWIWLTDDVEPDPYDSNPSYLSSLITYLLAVPATPDAPTSSSPSAPSSTPEASPVEPSPQEPQVPQAPTAEPPSGNSNAIAPASFFLLLAALIALFQ